MKNKFKYIVTLPLLVLLWSCRNQQIYKTPTIETPENYRGAEVQDTATNIGKIVWKDFFKDEQLQQLITQALSNNVNMNEAIKNMDIARLTLTQASAAYLPKLNLNIKASTTNPSDYSYAGLSLEQFLGTKHQEDYSITGSLSWEIDIWGKIKSKKEAALLEYVNTEEAKNAIQTQLVYDVANGYYSLVLLHQLKDIAEKNLKTSTHTLAIVKSQYDVGDATLLALEQSDAQKKTSEALIPEYDKKIQLQENAIQVLCGKFPDSIHVQPFEEQDTLGQYLSTGIPIQLLSQRPDIRKSEILVRKAYYVSRADKASMYPSFTISADGGIGALKASNWFNLPGSILTLLSGSIAQPIFNQKQLKTQYQISIINSEKAELKFKQNVVEAVGEVSDAMITIRQIKKKEGIVNEKNKKLQNAVGYADNLFKEGEATYLEVLTAQNNLLNSDIETAELKNDRIKAVLQLYKALGGGWKN